MRTNIVIDDRLMKQAMGASGAATKREVVERGLKTLIALKKRERIRRFRGKLRWDGDLDAIRRTAKGVLLVRVDADHGRSRARLAAGWDLPLTDFPTVLE